MPGPIPVGGVAADVPTPVERAKHAVETTDGFYSAPSAIAQTVANLHPGPIGGPFGGLMSRIDGAANWTENGFLHGAEGKLGAGLGGLSILSGGAEIANGQVGQGVLDLGAGGLSLANTAKDGLQAATMAGRLGGEAGLVSKALPWLGPASFAAGMIADGNGWTQKQGWWGQDAQGNNKDSIGWTIDNTAGAYQTGRNAFAGTGSRVLTDLGGAASGLVAGAASTGMALAGDFAGGVIDTGQTIVGAAGDVAQWGGKLLTNPGAAMQDVGNLASSAWNTGGQIVGGVANTVGNIIHDPGAALGNGANMVGGIASSIATGAGNVIGAGANALGAIGSDIGHDAGGLLSWGGKLATDPGAAVSDAANFGGSVVGATAGLVGDGIGAAANIGGNVVNAVGNTVGNVAGGIGNAIGNFLSW